MQGIRSVFFIWNIKRLFSEYIIYNNLRYRKEKNALMNQMVHESKQLFML